MATKSKSMTIQTSSKATEASKTSITTISSIPGVGLSRSHKSMSSRLKDSFEAKCVSIVMVVLLMMMVLISEALYCDDAQEC